MRMKTVYLKLRVNFLKKKKIIIKSFHHNKTKVNHGNYVVCFYFGGNGEYIFFLRNIKTIQRVWKLVCAASQLLKMYTFKPLT